MNHLQKSDLFVCQARNQYPNHILIYESTGMPNIIELSYQYEKVTLTIYPHIAFKKVDNGYSHSFKEYVL